MLASFAITAAFLITTILYVHKEQFFYFWDNFAYHRATLESVSALQQPGTSWMSHLRVSMQSGFSQLFTVPLAPLMLCLGESRSVYIGGITIFYLLPCAWLCTVIVNRIVPLHRLQWPLVFMSCASLPVFWQVTLRGYPDIGGIVVALVAILLITGDRGITKWSTAILLGIVLAATFLFRRHLVYCIIPLMAATSCFALAHTFYERPERRWREVLLTLARLTLTTGLTIFLIWLVAPSYFRELITTNFRELYLPFQHPVLNSLHNHWNYIGSVYWALGLFGFFWGMRRAKAQKWICGFLLFYAFLSFAIWGFYLRYLSVQYNLHFAVVIAIGLGLLTALVSQHFKTGFPALCLIIALVALWGDRLSHIRFLPGTITNVLPERVMPLRNPDYDEIKRLIEYLHNAVEDRTQTVIFDSSNQIFNSDMVSIGEQALYGRKNKTNILYGGHMDTVSAYPLRDMVAADWVVHTEPYQWHINIKDQGIVEAVCRTFSEKWKFSDDFEKKGSPFALSQGVTVQIYRRIRPTSFLTAVTTARQVFDFVGVDNAWNGRWMCAGAATGAEYFDARLIRPLSNGHFIADLEQVRMRTDQNEVLLFVRLAGGKQVHLSGKVFGSNPGGIDITAEYFPDSETTPAPTWTTTLSVPHQADFALAPNAPAVGVLALHIVPQQKPPLGSPLGIVLDELTLAESP